MTHSEFLLATIGYQANHIEPGIDKRDNKLKMWHYPSQTFTPFRTPESLSIALDYCVFAKCYLPLN